MNPSELLAYLVFSTAWFGMGAGMVATWRAR